MVNFKLMRRFVFVLLCKALSSFLIFGVLLWMCRCLVTLYSGELVLLNKRQILGGGAYLDCYQN